MSKIYTNEELSQKVDALSEVVNDKADRDLNNVTPPYLLKREQIDGVIVETWSDGYCVQRSTFTTKIEYNVIVNLAVPYKDTTYYVSSHGEPPKGRDNACGISFVGSPCTENKTVSSFKMATCKAHATQYAWETKGYIR